MNFINHILSSLISAARGRARWQQKLAVCVLPPAVTRTLRNVRRGALRLRVSGRTATVTIQYRGGPTREVTRSLCGWV